jgi:hypothetical protein
VCQKWISKSKFHIGVSDNASNVTLAPNSDTDLEAPDDLRARAMAEPEEFDDADDDDDEDRFPPLAPMHEGSAGCFSHLLNLIVEVRSTHSSTLYSFA